MCFNFNCGGGGGGVDFYFSRTLELAEKETEIN